MTAPHKSQSKRNAMTATDSIARLGDRAPVEQLANGASGGDA
jgi:hypothetical protein